MARNYVPRSGSSFEDTEEGNEEAATEPAADEIKSGAGYHGPRSIASPEALRSEWSLSRRRLATVLESAWFDVVMGLVVTCNVVVMITETDQSAFCLKQSGNAICNPEEGVQVANRLFLCLYMLELALQLYVFRRSYCSFWNNMDTGIVLLSIFAEVLGSVARNLRPLRLLRLLRLTRVVRAMSSFRELYMMLHGMIVTLKAVFWAAVLMFGLLTIWSIISVEVLYPEVLKVAADGGFSDCEWCLDALSSVYKATLALFETVVLGETWGSLMGPLSQSSSWLMALPILFGVFFTVVIGLMNLVLAVIVDFAVDAREEDQKMQAMLKDKRREEARAQLMTLCRDMDTDAGGTLTFQEFMDGFDYSEAFKETMQGLDIDKEDAECVFRIMDADQSGDVSYKELADLLYKMKAQNSRTLLLFIKHYTMEIRASVKTELHHLKTSVTTKLDRIAMIVADNNQKIFAQQTAGASTNVAQGPPPPESLRQAAIAEGNVPVLPSTLNLDGLDKLDLKIEISLAALRVHTDRKIEEQCGAVLMLAHQGFQVCEERFGNLLSEVRADSLPLASAGVSLAGIPAAGMVIRASTPSQNKRVPPMSGTLPMLGKKAKEPIHPAFTAGRSCPAKQELDFDD